MPPSTKKRRTRYLANRRQPTVKTPPTTPKITLPTTPKITLSTPTVRNPPTPKINLPTSTPKITLSTTSEPKLTLPTYSGGFTSNQKNQTQTTANNNYSQEDNFLKKYPQILLVIPLIIIILSKNK